MKLVLRFLKPHWKMCLLTVFLLLVDVVGALIIPTFAAELMNQAGRGVDFDTLVLTAIYMGVSALIAGGAAIGSVFAASDLTARWVPTCATHSTKSRSNLPFQTSALSVRHRSPQGRFPT